MAQRTENYEPRTTRRTGTMAKDIETVLSNALATILAGLAIAAGVIGLLVAFGYINGTNSINHFDDGMVWLVSGLVLGICANVFRREHHVVDPSETMPRDMMR